MKTSTEEDKKDVEQVKLALLKINGKKVLKFINDYYNKVKGDLE